MAPSQARERLLTAAVEQALHGGIADGERDSKALAALAAAHVKGGRAAIERSLDGMAIGGRHPMLIRAHLDHITLLDRMVAAIEDEIEAALDAIPAAGESAPTASRPPIPARARRTSSSAATCSAVSSGFFFVTVSSVSLITAPLPLNTRLSDQCRKHL